MANNIQINETNFPDKIFRKYIAKNFDKKGSGILTEEQLNAVTEIDCKGKKITSIKGIEHFKNLVHIESNVNEITSLDVSNNPLLKELYLGGNKLTSLDLSNNPELTLLYCHANQLTSLDVSNNPLLKEFKHDKGIKIVRSKKKSKSMEKKKMQYLNEKLLSCALENETTINDVVLKKKDLGHLSFPTGKIMVGCPGYPEDDDKVFTISVAPGNYPVSFSVNTDDEVVLVALKFSDKKPVRWEMAIGEEEEMPEFTSDDPNADYNESYIGYYTDGGSMGFMDAKFADLREDEEVSDKISEMDDGLVSITDGEQNEIVGFGVDPMCSYPSYFGFDEGGKPCVLVADLLIFR